MGKMHADEAEIDVSLVRRLLAAQFPQGADLPVEPFPSSGTVDAVYRLGEHLSVRLPRIENGVGDATWARGRGWALSMALIQLPYYLHTSPGIAANARYVIGQVPAGRITDRPLG
ncbi:hypothetical protein [Nonomuraea sp. GTA35]|uniref:hypothetical protein n=1 Tax=Nonomuraea sp. GTA35 TaxID=1676746 RepID=UPI0035C0396B